MEEGETLSIGDKTRNLPQGRFFWIFRIFGIHSLVCGGGCLVVLFFFVESKEIIFFEKREKYYIHSLIYPSTYNHQK